MDEANFSLEANPAKCETKSRIAMAGPWAWIAQSNGIHKQGRFALGGLTRILPKNRIRNDWYCRVKSAVRKGYMMIISSTG